jgi:hypothetical protein
MSKAKHTQGPWQYTGGDVWREIDRGFHPEQELIAQCSTTNAPLIAAAPELLEALEDALRHLPPGQREEAGKLIAKARGINE